MRAEERGPAPDAGDDGAEAEHGLDDAAVDAAPEPAADEPTAVGPRRGGESGVIPEQATAPDDRIGADEADLPPSDGELAERVRAGDTAAFEELYRRHVDPVRRYARSCSRDAHTAEDLTGEVFARTLRAMRGGAGPTVSVRAYLLSSVRRVAADWGQQKKREHLVEDFAAFAGEAAELDAGGGPPVSEAGADVRAMAEADRTMAIRAFRSLPERYQAVLWHTTVERESPREIAPLLGLTANATAVLAHRAREGLRQAYLQEHVSLSLGEFAECRRYAERLGAYARGALRLRADRSLREHLDGCARCTAAYAELSDVNASLRALLPVAFIGWFGASYAAAAAVASAGGAAAGGAAAAGTAFAATGGTTAAGGAAGGAAAGGGGGAAGAAGGAASEGLGAPAKAGIVAAVVVAVAAGLAFALSGSSHHPRAAAKPTPSVAVQAGNPKPAPSAKPAPPAAQSPKAPPQTQPAPHQPAPARSVAPPPKAAPPAPKTPAPTHRAPTPTTPAAPTPARPRPTPSSPAPKPSPTPSRKPTPKPTPPPPAVVTQTVDELPFSWQSDGSGPAITSLQALADRHRLGPQASVDGTRYQHAMTVFGPGTVTVQLNGTCTEFHSLVGVDDLPYLPSTATSTFSVVADGRTLASSAPMARGEAARALDATLPHGTTSVQLVTTPHRLFSVLSGNDWINASFTCTKTG